jgi:hypothetical protein
VSGIKVGTLVHAIDVDGRPLRREIVWKIRSESIDRIVITEDEEFRLVRLPEESRIATLAAWRGSIGISTPPNWVIDP